MHFFLSLFCLVICESYDLSQCLMLHHWPSVDCGCAGGGALSLQKSASRGLVQEGRGPCDGLRPPQQPPDHELNEEERAQLARGTKLYDVFAVAMAAAHGCVILCGSVCLRQVATRRCLKPFLFAYAPHPGFM